MHKKTLLFLTLLGLTLNSCLVTNGSYDEVYTAPRAATPGTKNITYSIHIDNELGGDSAIKEDDIRHTIQQELMDSNFYQSVTYSPSNIGGNNHYHFTFHIHGLDKGQRSLLGFIHGFSFFALPVWHTQKVDITLQAHGRTYETNQYARTYMWAPFILAIPFANGKTATHDIVSRSTAFFLSEINSHNTQQ